MLDSEVATVAITVVPQQSGHDQQFRPGCRARNGLTTVNNFASSVVAVELSPRSQRNLLARRSPRGAALRSPPRRTAQRRFSINGQERHAAAGQQQLTLNVTNATAADEADYTIQVSNRVGSVVSQIAHLTVLVPPSITQHPQSTTNYAGGSLCALRHCQRH
jgi:hypothetical protein